jgi:hypothetical protein
VLAPMIGCCHPPLFSTTTSAAVVASIDDRSIYSPLSHQLIRSCRDSVAAHRYLPFPVWVWGIMVVQMIALPIPFPFRQVSSSLSCIRGLPGKQKRGFVQTLLQLERHVPNPPLLSDD